MGPLEVAVGARRDWVAAREVVFDDEGAAGGRRRSSWTLRRELVEDFGEGGFVPSSIWSPPLGFGALIGE